MQSVHSTRIAGAVFSPSAWASPPLAEVVRLQADLWPIISVDAVGKVPMDHGSPGDERVNEKSRCGDIRKITSDVQTLGFLADFRDPTNTAILGSTSEERRTEDTVTTWLDERSEDTVTNWLDERSEDTVTIWLDEGHRTPSHNRESHCIAKCHGTIAETIAGAAWRCAEHWGVMEQAVAQLGRSQLRTAG
ncbi:cGMP-specific 3',5'-cyclic phosphodiesterase [Frankliniella fusca]|uniref:cGMP-specific 3',5'-cyclic phosphodiesterase n=1 Tax=Frankliniella fusca TaxID=407009 RepID=A0AAE1HXJ9_9NEOP|nr:cGMP-specific 3',5'-cyclic phosphodiesterase [Frankliniella fusca]